MPPLDSIFKRDDIRGVYPSELNDDIAEALGRALMRLLHSSHPSLNPAIFLGRDCRLGSLPLARAFARGVESMGGSILDAGLVSTEHIYFLCGTRAAQCAAGVMITASHNPREYDGMKFLHAGCLPFTPDELQQLRRLTEDELLAPSAASALSAPLASDAPPFRSAALDFQEYAAHMLKLSGLDKMPPLAPLRLLVLAGHGMGGVAFAPLARELEQLQIQTVILDGEPDGSFPQGVPNPLLPHFIQRLGNAVREHHADLGILFDGDADRAGFVDADGQEIIPSQVLALIARHKVASSGRPHPAILRNLCCSQLLRHIFPPEGVVELIDTPVGHGRIKQLMRSPRLREQVLFAGEHSGHFFYPEFQYVDSGVLTSLYMVAILRTMKNAGRNLQETLQDWRRNYCWSGEKNYDMPSQELLRQAIRRIAEAFGSRPGVLRYGVKTDAAFQAQRAMELSAPYAPEELGAPDLKLLCDHGGSGWWFVLRPSGNEPKLRLNAEGWGCDASRICRQITEEIEELLMENGATRA